MSGRELLAYYAGQARSIEAVWEHANTVWESRYQVWRKESGTWVLWWPLPPGDVTAVRGEFFYRNDNIELDIDWDPPIDDSDIVDYRIEVVIEDALVHSGSQPTNATYTPDRAFQEYAYKMAIISVTPVSDMGVVGSPTYSPEIPVPQLPPPPPPTNVSVTVPDQKAIATWDHVNGNRLSSFELETTFNDKSNATTAKKADRSADVTFWEPEPIVQEAEFAPVNVYNMPYPGFTPEWENKIWDDATQSWVGKTAANRNDPRWDTPYEPPAGVIPGSVIIVWSRETKRAAGPVGFRIRAIGPGGQSAWVDNSSGPGPVEAAGGATVWNHRFLNGVLQCNFSVNYATGTKAWYQKEGSDPVPLPNAGTSGVITVPASSSWARDGKTRYRIIIQGFNADGDTGPKIPAQWCIKLQNPISLESNVQMNEQRSYQSGGEWYSTTYRAWGTRVKTSVSSTATGHPTETYPNVFVAYATDPLFDPLRLGYVINVSKAWIMLADRGSNLGSADVDPNVRAIVPDDGRNLGRRVDPVWASSFVNPRHPGDQGASVPPGQQYLVQQSTPAGKSWYIKAKGSKVVPPGKTTAPNYGAHPLGYSGPGPDYFYMTLEHDG